MKELRDNPILVKEARARGEKHIIVAASLQDLAGSNRNKGVKYNHKFLEEEKLTKIFVDEAHYAMLNRSPEYSKILHNDEYADFEDLTGLNKKNSKNFAKNIGALDPEYGVSYITATPYDALYSGLFDFNENNTSIITAQDIQEEHKKWCKENPDKPESESPYFGIPQPFSYRVPFSMPWEQLLETTPDGDLIHRDYIKHMFSDLFGVTTQGYSANVFNNSLFKENRLGNGIIITVDRQKIADQFEDILNEVLEEKNYSILNISSDRGNKYSDMPTNRIQQVIENLSNKFIVITVNRMMTGSTIRKVDTVLFARHISSASALIQYLGRAGSPYVVEVVSDDIDPVTGKKKTEKVCMKPYCAALFLDPTAALTVHDQQLKFVVDHKDYSDSEEGAYRAATQELLETNPIIDYDKVTGQLREMTVNDIMSLTIENSKYLTDPFRSRIKGVNAFNIKNIDNDSIVRLNSLVFKSAGIQDLIVNYFDEEKYDSDIPEGVCKIKDCGLAEFKDFLCKKHYDDLDSKIKETVDRVEKGTVSKKNSADNHMMELLDRMDDLAVQCMIYVVLHPDTIRSMREVVRSTRNGVGARISKNIGLDVELLEHFVECDVFKPSIDVLLEQQEMIYSEMSGDSKIVDIMKSLKSLSVNEIISSDAAVKLLNDKIDFSVLSDKPAFLDNGCKSGVILIDIAERLKENGYSESVVRGVLWCIPTSGLTYEIILLVYESYNWNTDHILYAGSDYSALEVNDFLVRYQCGNIDEDNDKDRFMLGLFDEVLKELADKNNSVNDVDIDTDNNTDNNTTIKLFDYVVSNPPYQLDASTAVNNTATNIFHKFYEQGLKSGENIIMIFPGGRWIQRSSKAGEAARTIYDTVLTIDWYPNADEKNVRKVFDGIRIPDGVCIVTANGNKADNITLNGVSFKRPEGNEILPLTNKGATIARKVFNKFDYFVNTNKKPVTFFDIPTHFAEKNPDNAIVADKYNDDFKDAIPAWIANDNARSGKRVLLHYIPRDVIQWNDKREKGLEKYKVCAPQAVAGKDPKTVKYKLVESGVAVGNSWVILNMFDTREEASNFIKYLNSKTARFLVEESKGGKYKTWGYFIPDLLDYTEHNENIDWDSDIDSQLFELFGLNDEEKNTILNS